MGIAGNPGHSVEQNPLFSWADDGNRLASQRAWATGKVGVADERGAIPSAAPGDWQQSKKPVSVAGDRPHPPGIGQAIHPRAGLFPGTRL